MYRAAPSSDPAPGYSDFVPTSTPPTDPDSLAVLHALSSRSLIPLLGIALWMVALPAAQAQAFLDRALLAREPDQADRFSLWNDCRPLPVHLSVFRNNFIDADLEEALLAAVGARLQRVRLYKAEESCVLSKCVPPFTYGKHYLPYLSVRVHFAPAGVGSIVIYTTLQKVLQDRVSGESRFSLTWEQKQTGNGGVAQLAQLLSEGIDNFVAVYLHVNESACGDPGR